MGRIKFIKTLGGRIRANGPGLVVALIALMLALAGGALAASGALTSKQKKEVTKIAKKYAGEKGAPGTNGTNGANGKDGANGVPGKDGESVKITAATLAECSEGGTKFTNATGTGKACNGEPGEPGEPGQPWTAGGTLPPGATETGSWAFNGTEEDEFGIWTPISFSIPLSAAIDPSHVHYGVAGSGGAFSPTGACPGGQNAPKALPGELCIFSGEVFQASYRGTFKYEEGFSGSADGASSAGALLIFDPTAATAVGAGSFAVTGCSTEVGSPAPCP